MITVEGKGDYSKTIKFLQSRQNGSHFDDLEKYGSIGVRALAAATPVDTHETASSWYFKVSRGKKFASISWHNDNIVDGIPVVVLIQYGHATKDGGYVQGRDFINPAIQPVFDKIADEVWKKVRL